jgi:FMN reductase
MPHHTIPDTPAPHRPTLITLVGNPRPRSRTLAAAQTVTEHLALALARATDTTAVPTDAPVAPAAPAATIDLADLATEILAPAQPRADAAREIAAGATVLVVATPVYKGSYTGLLKAFLDRYGPDGLAGVVAVPVVVSGDPAHALAGETHLRPLLVELGATVPTRTLTLLDSRLSEPDLTSTIDAWLERAHGPLTRAVGGAVVHDAARTALVEATR